MKSHRKLWIAIVSTLVVLAWTLCALGQSAPTTKPVGPMVWSQPLNSFDKWKARGVPTIYRYEDEGGATSLDDFCNGLRTRGMSCVLQIEAAKHFNDAVCIGAFLGNDEFHVPGPKHQSPSELAAAKAEIRKITAKDCYISLNGGAVLTEDETELAAYCALADVVTVFHYPYNFGAGPAGVIQVGQILDKLHRLAPGKPIVFVGECSNQLIGKQAWTKQNDSTGTPLSPKMRGPNADEMGFEYGIAIGHGADGVCYFPDKIGVNWEAFDGTTPECEFVMKNINARWAAQPATYAASANLQIDFSVNGVKYVPAK